MIQTESLTKYYGQRCAVRDLSVEIDDHEIVGFLGLNGAGKTTTLRMLAGLLAPSHGQISIDGHNMLARGANTMRWRIGFLPERPPVYEEMTVFKYLRFAAELRGLEASQSTARVTEVLDMIDLRAYENEPIANLSHGYRQRAGIGQAIVHDPALVILDEPTSGLDPVQIVEMRKLIRSLKDQHTVLLSSHNLPEISQSCDRLMVIREGTLVAVGTEQELRARMDNGEKVVIEARGDATQIKSLLDDLETQGRITHWTVHPSPDTYIVCMSPGGQREDVAKAIVEHGHGLRRMQPEANELEDLFLELTQAPT